MNARRWWRAGRRYAGFVWEGWKLALAKRLIANISEGQRAATVP